MTDDERRISEIEWRVRASIKNGRGMILQDDFDRLLASRMAWKLTAKCPTAASKVADAEADRELEQVYIESAIDRMGWPEIHAFRAELDNGQSVYEDAGGFFMRAIKRLFGLPGSDEVVTYQRAMTAMIEASRKIEKAGR